MEMIDRADADERYFNLLAQALRVCALYKPKLGSGSGMTLDQFRRTYGADPFYSWVGLDSPLVYAAHKAAGGLTSIYRQLGIGCQKIFNQLLQDSLGLTVEQASWTYEVPLADGRVRSLSLDGRVKFADVRDSILRGRIEAWTREAAARVLVSPEMRDQLRGVVFEVRQGYKSKDSKRQNADIFNASNAYLQYYLPVIVLFSTQIDLDLANRYAQARWVMLTGTTNGQSIDSTYQFCHEVLGYDLAGFFKRNSQRIRTELVSVLNALLKA